MKNILINATAAKTSGALTVLNDCISWLESLSEKDNIEYHLFTVVDDFNDIKNIRIHKLPVKDWFSRIIWDNGGMQKWCRRNNIEANAILSLQNTCTKYRNRNGLMIIQVVYYHQTIPLIKYKWNWLDKQEFKMWLYHYFYPFFVNRNNKTARYIVQLPYIKKLFLERFKNIKENKVFVIKPNISMISFDTRKKLICNKKYAFIYPATALRYKNHKVLIDALKLLRKDNETILDDIEIIFTIDNSAKYLFNEIILSDIKEYVHCIGVKPYSELLSYYKSVTALLFPSVLESFGLPLLEAAAFGTPIIVSDLSYAHEVLEGYDNVKFACPYNAGQWANLLKQAGCYKYCMPLQQKKENSWKEVFAVMEKSMTQGVC
jgi:glycosyltransferase involved in cell wall biosynthesis